MEHHPRTYEAQFRVLTYDFAVRTHSPAIAAVIEQTFGGFRAEATPGIPIFEFAEDHGDGRPRVRLRRGNDTLLDPVAPERALDVFAWEVMDTATRRCDDQLLVHAGAVATGGVAVLLPAASGSGKTTLVAGLVAAGFSYLSDEIAAVLPGSGSIAPFPLALSVKSGSFEVLASLLPELPPDVERMFDGRVPIRAEDIRTDAHAAVVPARFVVAPRYVAGARTAVAPVSRADGLGELVRNAFNLDRFGRDGFNLLTRVVRGASCYRLTSGDLDDAVRAVGRIVQDVAA